MRRRNATPLDMQAARRAAVWDAPGANKMWAKRIIERHKAGQPVLPNTLKAACDALGVDKNLLQRTED